MQVYAPNYTQLFVSFAETCIIFWDLKSAPSTDTDQLCDNDSFIFHSGSA